MDLSSASINAFVNHLTINGFSEHTIRAYRGDLTGLWASVPTVYSDLEAEAAAYLTRNRKVWAPKTTDRKLTAFRAYAKFHGEDKFLSSYRAPTPARPVAHPIPEGMTGVIAMLDATRTPEDAALVALTGLCGLRVGEALTITPAAVDSREKVVLVRGKGDRSRRVPISTRAWDALQPALMVTAPTDLLVPLVDRTARRRITSIARRAGLGHVASHDMRSTFATTAFASSRNLRAVQELLGHASSATTEGYTAVSDSTLRDAVEV